MDSLVILMIEAEQPEGISSRKLVVETAKHNVLTAYEPDKGLNLLRRFPNVDAVLLHSTVIDGNTAIVDRVRQLAGKVPVIVACPNRGETYPGADYVVESHQPQQLLNLLAAHFGISKRTDE